MRAFYDFEFVEDGKTIDPLSLGIVLEDGREYYAVFNDPFTMLRAIRHPWLRKNVVPSLPVTVMDDGLFLWDKDHPDFKNIRTVDQIRREVLKFLDVPDLKLWAWFTSYDHVALSQIWGRMIDLPLGIPMRSNDLAQEHDRLGRPELPEQPPGEHNALEDARFNLVRAFWLDNLAERVG